MLLEFIRSYLESLNGDTLAINLKGYGKLSVEIILYDALDLINQVESGNKSPIPKVLGTAKVEHGNVVEVQGDPIIEYFAKKYAKMESQDMRKFINNHYKILNYLRKNDARVDSVLK